MHWVRLWGHVGGGTVGSGRVGFTRTTTYFLGLLSGPGPGAGLTPKDFPVEHSVIGRVGYPSYFFPSIKELEGTSDFFPSIDQSRRTETCP